MDVATRTYSGAGPSNKQSSGGGSNSGNRGGGRGRNFGWRGRRGGRGAGGRQQGQQQKKPPNTTFNKKTKVKPQSTKYVGNLATLQISVGTGRHRLEEIHLGVVSPSPEVEIEVHTG